MLKVSVLLISLSSRIEWIPPTPRDNLRFVSPLLRTNVFLKSLLQVNISSYTCFNIGFLYSNLTSLIKLPIVPVYALKCNFLTSNSFSPVTLHFSFSNNSEAIFGAS